MTLPRPADRKGKREPYCQYCQVYKCAHWLKTREGRVIGLCAYCLTFFQSQRKQP